MEYMDKHSVFGIDLFAFMMGLAAAFYAIRAMRVTVSPVDRARFAAWSLSAGAISVLLQAVSTVIKYFYNIG